jgi:hypothetical protein
MGANNDPFTYGKARLVSPMLVGDSVTMSSCKAGIRAYLQKVLGHTVAAQRRILTGLPPLKLITLGVMSPRKHKDYTMIFFKFVLPLVGVLGTPTRGRTNWGQDITLR